MSMVKQKETLEAVMSLLKKAPELSTIKVYTDEIVKGYKQPCFFVKLIKLRSAETKNTDSNSISIVLTYHADATTNKQIFFLNTGDAIEELFGKGIKVGTRYLHVKTIAAERIGEDSDILQLIISVNYLDSTGYDGSAGYDLMQELNINYTNKN